MSYVTSPVPNTTLCDRCGSVVADAVDHDSYHALLDQLVTVASLLGYHVGNTGDEAS